MSEEEANEMEELYEYLEKEHAEVKYNKQVSSETPFSNMVQAFFYK